MNMAASTTYFMLLLLDFSFGLPYIRGAEGATSAPLVFTISAAFGLLRQ